MRKPYYIKAVLSMPPLQFPKKITTVAAVWVCIEIWIWIWIWNWITGTSGHSFQEQRTPRRNKKPNPRHRSTASRDSEKIVLQACFWRVSKTRCKKKKKIKKKNITLKREAELERLKGVRIVDWRTRPSSKALICIWASQARAAGIHHRFVAISIKRSQRKQILPIELNNIKLMRFKNAFGKQ